MRISLVILICLLFQLTAYADTGVFGLRAGAYGAVGKLKSTFFPDITFRSLRRLQNGTLSAETRASILGFPIAARANLKVVFVVPNKFDLLDMDRGQARAGQGTCDANGCVFDAVVMNGALALRERWRPTPQGFEVIEASQKIYGIESTYSATFTLGATRTSHSSTETLADGTKVFVPSVQIGDGPLPVVLLLHGYMGNQDWIDAYLGYSDQVEARKFILIVPNGEENSQGLRFWNASPACCDFDHRGHDDVQRLKNLVLQVIKNRPADLKRIFAVGHSNGGFMAHRLGCDANDLFTGVVSFAGAGPMNAQDCAPGKPVSVLQIHAVDDDTIHFAGDAIGYEGLTGYPSAPKTIKDWAVRNRCQTGAQEGAALNVIASIPGIDTKTYSWKNCAAATELWQISPYKSAFHASHTPFLNDEFTNRTLDFVFDHARD